MFGVARQTVKSDDQYPVTPEWRERVKTALGKERGAQARLARRIKCSPGTLTDLLNHGRRSHLVPQIHKALGWPPPPPLTDSLDNQEVTAFVGKLGDRGRDVLKSLMDLDEQQLELAVGVIEQMARGKSHSND